MTQRSPISMPATTTASSPMTTSLELGLIHDRRFGSRFAPAAAEYARIADGRKAERPGAAALRQNGQERLMDGCFPLGSASPLMIANTMGEMDRRQPRGGSMRLLAIGGRLLALTASYILLLRQLTRPPHDRAASPAKAGSSNPKTSSIEISSAQPK